MEICTWNGYKSVKMISEVKQHSDNFQYYGFDLLENMTN